MAKHLFLFLSLLLLLFYPYYLFGGVFTCPMHPRIVSDSVGSCPICGMDLVLLEGSDDVLDGSVVDVASGSDSGGEILYWVAPMDPSYRMDGPGKSPMGMDLVPVYSDGSSSGSDSGRVIVKISPETIQNMGIRTELVTMSSFGSDIRSYGIITPNERLRTKIYSRVDGWITDLGVSAIGDSVLKGDHIYTIHSPDLVLAQQDLLSLERIGRNTDFSKLFVHYSVDESFVADLRKSKTIRRDVPYYSPYSGTVSALNVRPGSYVTLNTILMVLEDYRSVWINVSVAEKDLRFLKEGNAAFVTFPNLGGVRRAGSIDYIYPTIDTSSRTGQVRLVLDNSDGVLKPGAYADVEFHTNVEDRLSIPSEAILKSSDGDFVVVLVGSGRFQPRKIETGISSKGRTEVLSGLDSGDEIVVSGQFLIDSESSLREAFRKMKKPKSKSGDKAASGGAHATH